MHSIVDAAEVQDLDGGAMMKASLFNTFQFLIKIYADSVTRYRSSREL